ncbi:unnamed protein product [Medioppia subpectinata]|uniref:Uncharacterized protein n=1 Tax=Medioppia subpectinata TaxID=1979941 RepID=A0A7R9KKR4_9ACAR|nr:unnamed protein product [Medioppia subpectinata]CAG2105270.1 unnamed protein product [Medioppia subpectinata]
MAGSRRAGYSPVYAVVVIIANSLMMITISKSEIQNGHQILDGFSPEMSDKSSKDNIRKKEDKEDKEDGLQGIGKEASVFGIKLESN